MLSIRCLHRPKSFTSMGYRKSTCYLMRGSLGSCNGLNLSINSFQSTCRRLVSMLPNVVY